MKQKDINDMIIAGYTKEDVQEIITENTFSGAEAQAKISRMEKDKCLVIIYQHPTKNLFTCPDILDGCQKKNVEKLGMRLLLDILISLQNT